MTTSPVRAAVVREALGWQGTPFHHRARLRGVGVDCANLLAAVFAAVGLVPELDLGAYPIDWHMHRDEPRFLLGLSQYADPLPEGELIQPGDVAMFRYGRHAAHGAIVVAWPTVVHAWAQVGRVVQTEVFNGPLAARLAGIYRIRGIES